MSRETRIQWGAKGDQPPQGYGWEFKSAMLDSEDCTVIIWVREPVVDVWQDHRTEVCDSMVEPTFCPAGYAPMGPWKQYAASSDTSSEFAHWRRPLRRIEVQS